MIDLICKTKPYRFRKHQYHLHQYSYLLITTHLIPFLLPQLQFSQASYTVNTHNLYHSGRLFSFTTWSSKHNKIPSTLFASAMNTVPNNLKNGEFNHQSSSPFCSSENVKNEQLKTTEELQSQWAGGRDVWKDVPILSSSKTLNIQTKIKEDFSSDNQEISSSTSHLDDWPEIIKSSILYGFGAYNPRGQTLPDEINREQHILLEDDIKNGLKKHQFENAVWWQGASLWEDGTSERGFIVAFQKENLDKREKAHAFIVQLAEKYNQGAIYKFEYKDRTLTRDTVAVLDSDTDASVQVVRDDVSIDTSIFT